MGNKNEVYTKLTAEVKFDDGMIFTYTVSRNQWDANVDEVGDMCRDLMMAMGFAETNVDEIFCDDCVNEIIGDEDELAGD